MLFQGLAMAATTGGFQLHQYSSTCILASRPSQKIFFFFIPTTPQAPTVELGGNQAPSVELGGNRGQQAWFRSVLEQLAGGQLRSWWLVPYTIFFYAERDRGLDWGHVDS
jgi:hypothetical protein